MRQNFRTNTSSWQQNFDVVIHLNSFFSRNFLCSGCVKSFILGLFFGNVLLLPRLLCFRRVPIQELHFYDYFLEIVAASRVDVIVTIYFGKFSLEFFSLPFLLSFCQHNQYRSKKGVSFYDFYKIHGRFAASLAFSLSVVMTLSVGDEGKKV